VVAAPLVELRRLDARDDVEVSGGRAAEPGFALSLQLDPRAVLHAGGDPNRVALRPPLTASAAAGRARRLDDSAVAATVRARLLQREEPLRAGDDTGAFALRAALGRGPGRGAGAVARVAGELERDGDGRLQALQRVLERDPHLDVDVGASLPALLLLRTTR